MWRRADNQQNAAIVELVLLDLGGVGGRAVVELPHDAIIASSSAEYFAVVPHRASGTTPTSHPYPVCAAACDNVEPLVGFFSARELCNGQLHVRAPSNGVASLHVVAASTSIGSAVADADARVVRAHLLSALFRLGRRGREYARSNDAAKILAGCACADAEKSACRWRDLWARLHPVSAEMVEPLGRILWAGAHMAAAAGLLDENSATSADVQQDLLRNALAGLRRVLDEEQPLGKRPSVVVASPSSVVDHTGGPTTTTTCCQSVAAASRLSVAFIAPEIGSWCRVGGLGTMVDHLSSAMAKGGGHSGSPLPRDVSRGGGGREASIGAGGGDVCVIAPAYLCFRERWSHLPITVEMGVPFGHRIVPVRVRTAAAPPSGASNDKSVNSGGVTVHLLEVIGDGGSAAARFSTPYPQGDAATRLTQPVLLARASLLLLDWLTTGRGEAPPSAIVTNDWLAALTAPYAHHTSWAGGHASSGIREIARSSLFIHLIHNLEAGYDGRLQLPDNAGRPNMLAALHQLPSRLLHTMGSDDGLHLTRAALLCSHGWGTVAPSYKMELLSSSSSTIYAPLLRQFGSAAIACDSGLPLSSRREDLKEYGDHSSAKAALQRMCFGEHGVNKDTTLLIYLGRIAYQKGVHLLLDIAPELLRRHNGKVQLLVCGGSSSEEGGSHGDAYLERCAAQMASLRARYPYHFWAAPHHFFEHGLLASLAADFGIMPSQHEPCGLVREEFFAAGTPLVCSAVGGLKERVTPYDRLTGRGEGLLYSQQTHAALLDALEEAVGLHAAEGKEGASGQQLQHYANLRRNAHGAACEIGETAWHWRCELQRLLACQCHARLHECV